VKKRIYFFIGTTAELIKLIPIMKELTDRGSDYKIIASGQNDIRQSELLKLVAKTDIDLVLSTNKIKKTPFGLLSWFSITFLISIFKLKKEFSLHKKSQTYLIVHGDTVSTVMGALFGKLFGLKVCHIEAGLRSFNYFQPFPEEIDRLITSRLTNIHFCPNEWASHNLEKRKGIKINTFQNTLVDSLQLAINHKSESLLIKEIQQNSYFIFVIHRQENLLNEKLVNSLINKIIKYSNNMTCVFVLHEYTKYVLNSMNLLSNLQQQSNISLVPRLPYLEFMQLLDRSEFIVTDGGSNQEEAYYLGKPCLLLRKVTERTEGLNENVLLSENNEKTIDSFFNNPFAYKREKLVNINKPSKIIVDYFYK